MLALAYIYNSGQGHKCRSKNQCNADMYRKGRFFYKTIQKLTIQNREVIAVHAVFCD